MTRKQKVALRKFYRTTKETIIVFIGGAILAIVFATVILIILGSR